jgi:TonB-dependent Receptor Plug Domain
MSKINEPYRHAAKLGTFVEIDSITEELMNIFAAIKREERKLEKELAKLNGLGDHAENSFSVDGQPITDQQSKVFSNQIPLESIQSLEVISGAPPAEFGDKTSLVIKVTTRSGLGQTTPTGSVQASYGSFGTTTARFRHGVWRPEMGKFHFGERLGNKSLSRSAGVPSHAFEGKPAKSV